MNTEEKAEANVGADLATRLAAKGLGNLGPFLGRLAIQTAENLANLTDKEWKDTLALIPKKRRDEDQVLEDPEQYAPGHFALLRQLREEVRREAQVGRSEEPMTSAAAAGEGAQAPATHDPEVERGDGGVEAGGVLGRVW